MRGAIFSVALFVVLSQVAVLADRSRPVSRSEAGNANDYIDKVLTNVRSLIFEKNYDPYTAIDKSILGVHLTGELFGIGTLHRAGEATLTVGEDDSVEVKAEFGVYDLKAKVAWSTKIIGLFPIRGSASGTIDEVTIQITLRADLTSVRLIIKSFYISHVGHIKTHLDTNSIPGFDTVATLVSDAMANLLKDSVVTILNGPIRILVQKAIDDIGIPTFEK